MSGKISETFCERFVVCVSVYVAFLEISPWHRFGDLAVKEETLKKSRFD
jgi:hypothetical protein